MAEVVIIGGGIGGLCTAYALQERGYDVTLYEGAGTFQSPGAGLGIGANALKALDKIGLKEQVMEHSKILRKMIILSETGKPITETDSLMISERFGTDNVTIHRADLLHVLRNALKPGTIVLNKRCVDFVQDQGGVTLSFEDGETILSDAVVAADGINSIFRRKLVPGSTPRYAGYTCWRGVICDPGIEINELAATETWGPSGRFGIVPLAGGRIYWFACVKAKPLMQPPPIWGKAPGKRWRTPMSWREAWRQPVTRLRHLRILKAKE